MRDLCAMKVFRGKRRATLRLPGRSGAGWEEPGAGGPPSSGNSTNQSAKARAITTNSNSNPVNEIARLLTWCRVAGKEGQRVGGLRCQAGFGWIAETREAGKKPDPGHRLAWEPSGKPSDPSIGKRAQPGFALYGLGNI